MLFSNLKFSLPFSRGKLQIMLFICVLTGPYLKSYASLSRYHAMQFAIFLFTWLQVRRKASFAALICSTHRDYRRH